MITGGTRLYAIIGDPVAPLRSPALFNAAFARQGRDAVFIALQIGVGELAQAWPGLLAVRNLDGLVITMPHKEAVVPLLARLGPAARLTGAVNTIRRDAAGDFEGEMFDGEGFADGLGQAVRGADVLLVGCGAAGRAIGCALARAGARQITLNDRTPGRAEALAALLAQHFPATRVVPGPADPLGHAIVVNATSLGLRAGDPSPLDVTRLVATQLVADVIPQPEITPLIAAARALGCATATGRDMHEGQARLAAAYLGIAD